MKKETIPEKLEKTLLEAKTAFEELSRACQLVASASKKFQASWMRMCMKAYEQGKKDGEKLRKEK